jgi:catechol 2,3-dioxygenase-like lactoylglutathione lyase family enzyme
MRVDFGGVTPIFRVHDLRASLDYYVRVLGFKIDWEAGGFVSVSRGKCGIFLCEGDQGNPPAWAWVAVSDAAALHEELRAKGAKIRHPPTNYEWAFEMQVEDLDGNVLRLGSDEKEGEPIGEWLDMNGVRWIRTADGRRTRATS